ncbi:Acyl transferase domain-containing protein [Actinokineospora diospyrosa]|uniref:Acyl transferase domain-containing protein n=1 Tax=Actinokineospora diospyrosa TaxID=103728 RepID=A0ABT1I843_9PSEU|nr:type I polyketide synthase [Actinokineospora diospyrosa]MCP2268758.1 Acyl transferase domain-containing protein [Actinokineospora diospyrosa]
MTDEKKYLEYLKRLTADLRQARRRLRVAEDRPHEPIAIVGMACRYPGGIASPEQLWELVAQGRDGVSPFPVDRGWDVVFDDDPDAPGTSYAREGGFVHTAAEFDATLFGISPREAVAMDPQQRILLETAWEAVERAGFDPLSLRGSRTGVFIGSSSSAYGAGLRELPPGAEGHLLTGNAPSVVSGRVAYTLGLEGPAVTVDTACSSSLVALHLAVQALRAGECDMALTGGVTVMTTPGIFTEFSRQKGLAADGRCKAFAAAADGTGWAEGAGVLVVERLADAKARGHRVLAVVRGTAVNSDGASNGLTAPNGPSQERVIRAALANARLTPADVDAVEAHGTGTTLGDPIEAQALLATYGQDRELPLLLGSIKSNLGHSQAAAGAAGIIKVVQALQHELLPKTLHVDTPTPHVDWAAGAVELLTEPTPWPRDAERPRRAGVSSFSVSGTNAHIVIEEADPHEPVEPVAPPAVLAWPVAARTGDALRAAAAALSTVEAQPVDVAWSLVTGRAALEHRAVVVGSTTEELRAGLAAVERGESAVNVVSGVARSDATPVFVFPGQGSQWVGMATGLLETSPVFAARMVECADALSQYVDWSLLDVVRRGEFDRVDVVQPVLWAVMVSLAELWGSVGVTPAAVIGHSQGEIAAAVVAGALSLEAGARVVALRSRAIAEVLGGTGGMVSLALPHDEAAALIERWPGLSVAAVNGPQSTVVSGDVAALDELLALSEESGVRARRVPVDYASHSAHVERLRDRLDLPDLAPRSAQVPFYSAVTGNVIDTAELDADYWYRNLRETVRFDQATSAALAAGHTVFIEVSAHPVLTVGLQETLEQAGTGTALATLRRDEGDLRRWLTAVAEAHVAGVRVDWSVLAAGGAWVDLPTYQFQRQHYWLAAPIVAAESWRYRVDWQPLPLGSGAVGTWAVVRTESVDGQWCLDALAARGVEPVEIVLADDDLDRWSLAERMREVGYPDGVVSLLAFDDRPHIDDEAVTVGVGGTLTLVQALGDAGVTAPLWCVTQGLDNPVQVQVWGLGRVAALEVPSQWGGLIDLPPGGDPAAVVAMLGGDEDQVVVRADGVFGRRLERAPEPRTATPLTLSGPVLVTGGTGALGAAVARWLVGRGASVVLASRRGLDAPGAAELSAELGATVVACDVADRASVEAVLAAHPVVGVVHAAGVDHSVPLDETDVAEFAEGLRAKVLGAAHLDELLGDAEIFVLFSSIAGVWGSGNQASYAAANAYLDALAESRRARGLQATSIAWGAWADAGMATRGGAGEFLRRRGINPMSPQRCLAGLAAAVDAGETAVTIADIDWTRFVPTFTTSRPSPLLAAFAPDVVVASDVPEVSALVGALADRTSAERRRIVLDAVRRETAVVLGYTDPVDSDRPFKDLGVDSVTAVEVRNRLTTVAGVRLPATVVFDYPNPVALADHLLGELLPEDAGSTDLPVASVGTTSGSIAIVGMSCRFPGGVNSPEALWQLVRDEVDGVSVFPTDRGWDLGRADGAYAPEGGFLYDATTFDADLFGISPREAASMDPQQRVLLEAAWEVLERSKIDPYSLRGTDTGVFVGASASGYGVGMNTSSGSEGHYLTGTSSSVMSGRLAYTFGLEGPAVTIDTACSSSLVALHLAMRALAAGECGMALVAGVAVMTSSDIFAEFSRQNGLAGDGRCKSFAGAADGTGWGEGVGALLVMPLDEAVRQGRDVLAVVRGSAVNSDGASNGLTAPNGPSQQRVIRAALADARLRATDVDVVEGHGTGTRLGDPIEAQALLATYGQERETPLWLGSLKSNIGHTQAASGMAGIMKMVMAMRHGHLPKTLHVDEPTPHVDWTAGSVSLLTDARPWPDLDRPRRAGISAFGVSGTNAHVILEQAPAALDRPPRPAAVVPWVFSGKTEPALDAQLDATPAGAPADIAHTLAVGRASLAHRAVLLDHQTIARGVAEPRRLGYLFTGQGSQRAGMGEHLREAFPVFAETYDAVVAKVPFGDDLGETGNAQPALFALQVAMFRLLESWGLAPDVLIGHSIGELAAAHVAGVLSLDDACTLVAARARLMQAIQNDGAMLAIEAAEDEVELPGGVDLAAVNSDRSIVVSGDRRTVEQFKRGIVEQGRRTTLLRVSHAFHSHHMDQMLDAFAEVARGLTYHEPVIRIVPTATGRVDSPEYWVRQVRDTVRFAEAVAGQDADFLELGPDGVLSALVDGAAFPLLRAGKPETDTAVHAVAGVWVRGAKVAWASVIDGGAPIDLPTYPFQRQRFWLDTFPAPPAATEDEHAFWAAVDQGDVQALATSLDLDQATLDAVLPALTTWRRTRTDRSTADSWRYRATWTPLPDPDRAPLGTWLAVACPPDIHDALRAHGAEVVELALTGTETDRWNLAQHLLGTYDGVVTAALPGRHPEYPDLPTAVALPVLLLQALGDAGSTAPLWCLTRGAQSTGRSDRPADPDQAALWGMGRVAALEFPARWGGLIDLPETLDSRAAQRLAAALTGAEDQVAIRPSGSYGRRITRATSSSAVSEVAAGRSGWLAEGTVLITGGTGALAARAAELVLDRGAEHLLLLSRSGPDAPRAQELLARYGDRVSIVAADIADRDALADAITGHDITAAFHTAGVVESVPLAETGLGEFADVLRAKVTGAKNLHELLPHAHLVLFSSIAATWGSGNQAAYSAANAYLDGLAEHRRARDLPVTSVAWGPWAGDGMLVSEDAEEYLLRRGLAAMDPALATAALAKALDNGDTTVTVADVDWSRFTAAFTTSRPSPLLADFAEPVPIPEQRPVDLGDLLTLVRASAAAVLGHSDPEAIEPGRPFNDLGFDSLTAVELRDRLVSATGLPLPATLVFDYPTARALADHLAGDLRAPEDIAAGADPNEPIAIIGMACRYPGGVRSPEDLWELVRSGGDGMGAFPTDRGWWLDGLYDPDPDNPASSHAHEGGFLYDVADFDAALFGVSPREAMAMDPQQRLLLETSWEAFEHAGINPLSLNGSSTGVFAGTNSHDYLSLLADAPEGSEGYLATGSSASVISGRVAYTFGLEGPAVTVDTACSSSLVALHMAVRALRGGECTMAVAGGVVVMSTPGVFTEFSRQNGVAPDGRCKSYADAADGTGWGEGVGVLVVERLSDARRNGHRVLAVVRGTAVNSDGASNGLTAPNGPSQQRVIRAALADAGLTTSDVDVVEGHGTGTRLGDPIEAQALLATYGQDRETPLWLGSVKSNIGHTQAASGVAGVIKVVQAMRHGLLPRTLHVDAPTSHVDWNAGAVRLLTESRPWSADRPRRAGVSSFGVSGTNAHIVLESVADSEQAAPVDRPVVPWVLSADTAQALREQAENLSTVEVNPVDTAWTLATARASLSHRAVVFGNEGLAALATGRETIGTGTSAALVFVFPGQGSQWVGMAVDLLDEPVFRGRIEECERALAPHVDWSLLDVLRGGDLERVEVVQPVLWAVMVSLASLWTAVGVRPAAVLGHSQGEIAAAVVAGGLTLEDGARVVALRAKAIAEFLRPETTPISDTHREWAEYYGLIDGEGGMVSLAASHADAQNLIASWPALSIAAVNGPLSTVVSGDLAALDELLAVCADCDVRAKRIPVDYASHSAHVERVRDRLLADLAPITPVTGTIPFHSAVTAGQVDTATLDANYWYDNLRDTVLFEQATTNLIDAGRTVFLEVSAHPVLTVGIQETLDATDSAGTVLTTLRRDEPGRWFTALAEAHVAGIDVDWAEVLRHWGGRVVDLPTYPFQRQRFWPKPVTSTDVAAAGLADARHPLLGAAVALAGDDGTLWTGRLSLATQPWLADHAVAGSVLLPGTAFVDLALHAGGHIDDLALRTPLVLPERGAVQLQVRANGNTLTVHSRPEAGGDWTTHATGTLSDSVTEPVQLPWPPTGEPLDTQDFYASLAEAGYAYGPTFRGLTAAWKSGDDVYAEVELGDAGSFGIHPALLDSALHAASLGGLLGGGTLLPFAWTGVTLHATGATALRVRISPIGADTIAVTATDPHGAPVITIESLALRPLTAVRDTESLYRIDWVPVAANAPAEFAEHTHELAEPLPPHIVWSPTATTPDEAALEALIIAQDWALDPRAADSRLVALTRHAVATGPGDHVDDLAGAAVDGLFRSAASENPGRFATVDLDDHPDSRGALPAALAAGEPRLAIRRGQVLAARLARVTAPALDPRPGTRLDVLGDRTIDNLAFVPDPERELGPNEVRVSMRAMGVNFRDVAITLGVVPDQQGMGTEGAGVVLAVGADVLDLEPGDRVFGVFTTCFATVATTDRRALARMRPQWSFAAAASVPTPFLTAYYGLVDLGGMAKGDTVLVHAAAGGVGMAAVQLARHFGAEPFGTAGPTKWTATGLADDHLASSRSLDFEPRLREATGGRGFDLVLNSLAGEYIDASLRLLAPGGRFIEMGKTDIRAGVANYQAFDLIEAGPDRLGEILAEVLALFDRGALDLLPVTAWDLRHAPAAFRHIAGARHIGKNVLTLPTPINPDGTVLVTGGSGVLAGILARQLVDAHGVRDVLLVSRSGNAPADMPEQARAVACDVTDRAAVEALLDGLTLTGVVHAAGVLDDGVLGSLTPDRLAAVLRPKVTAALLLDELTAHHDLAFFVLYSSASATLGTAGQANYAAANAVLDALAQRRRARGLPAQSLAWGLWEQASGMTGHLGQAHRARAGGTISAERGMALFDSALTLPDAHLVPIPLDLKAIVDVPPLLRGLVRPVAATRAKAGAATPLDLGDRLARLPEPEQRRTLVDLVRDNAAAVLGHADATAVGAQRAFKELGFDSLTGVELRNRLAGATDLRLPATLVFDHPTPVELADRLWTELLGGADPDAVALADLDRLTATVQALPVGVLADSALADRLRALLETVTGGGVAGQLESASADDVFDFIDKELGVS